PVGEIDLLAAEESTRILADWNDTAHAVDPDATLVSLLDATVAATPKGGGGGGPRAARAAGDHHKPPAARGGCLPSDTRARCETSRSNAGG
ncbi:hypothetical protein, partial [Nocardia brasiliensis]|uniref:hypothetical protein n=1 Tax=Nocardia brasiliensis TaxID=37326 RepID=UPI0024549639